MTDVPPLEPDVWRQLAAHYPNLEGVRRAQRAPTGNDSCTWILFGSGRTRRVILRQYREAVKEQRIRFEHAILSHLRKQDFPCPDPLPACTGATFVRVGRRHYCLFGYCEGTKLAKPVLRWLRGRWVAQTGEMLADYHIRMRDFRWDGEMPGAAEDHEWAARELTRYRKELEGRASEDSFAREVLRRMGPVQECLSEVRRFFETDRRDYSPVVIHGDFGPSNVLYGGGKIVGVLDFLAARAAQRVVDLAYGLAGFSKWRDSSLHRGLGQRFLRGYQGRHPLPSGELETLPYWMMLNQLKRLRWILVQFYERGNPRAPAWFSDNYGLLLWIRDHPSEIAALG